MKVGKAKGNRKARHVGNGRGGKEKGADEMRRGRNGRMEKGKEGAGEGMEKQQEKEEKRGQGSVKYSQNTAISARF